MACRFGSQFLESFEGWRRRNREEAWRNGRGIARCVAVGLREAIGMPVHFVVHDSQFEDLSWRLLDYLYSKILTFELQVRLTPFYIQKFCPLLSSGRYSRIGRCRSRTRSTLPN